MDKLCQFSTIVFAGNVSILLIVAVTTDYWEYRAFNRTQIIRNVSRAVNTSTVIQPYDTDSYMAIRYERRHKPLANVTRIWTELHYESPAAVFDYYKSGSDGRKVKYEVVIVLFLEYANLFRECHNLEGKWV